MTMDGDRKSVIVHFAAGLYNLDAIKRAAYRFTDRAATDIQPSADGITCTLRALSAKVDVATLEDEFRNEVLDQDLRIAVAQETEPLRNLVLSIAFSKTGLQE